MFWKIRKKGLYIKNQAEIFKLKDSLSEYFISVDETDLKYRLRFSKRAKNIQLQINQQADIYLVLPYRISKFDHRSYIRSKSGWIKKHLEKFNYIEFYLLGEQISIVKRSSLLNLKPIYKMDKKILTAYLPSMDTRSLGMIFNDWLYKEAKSLLPLRVFEIAAQHSFSPEKIAIKRQRTRWGSCSQSGTISLNYKMLSLKQELIDYIIVHELCHLKEMNHSKKFWNLVESIIPNHKTLRKELKQIRIFN